MNIHTRLKTNLPIPTRAIPVVGKNCSSYDWIAKRPSSRCWRLRKYQSITDGRLGLLNSIYSIFRRSRDWAFGREKSSGLCWRRDYYHRIKRNPWLKGKL